MHERQIDALDRFIIGLDEVIRAGRGPVTRPQRRYPAEDLPADQLGAAERRHSGALMRVNHAGEVAAQALYRAQGTVARSPRVREAMEQAAAEESDHLAWCRQRLGELGDRTSLLDPAWYLGSFGIGSLAGLLGDRWNLGFVAETERQVEQHLERHLHRLPATDTRSRAIVSRMQADEGRHATAAVEAGAAVLPKAVTRLMRFCAQVMTTTAYRI